MTKKWEYGILLIFVLFGASSVWSWVVGHAVEIHHVLALISAAGFQFAAIGGVLLFVYHCIQRLIGYLIKKLSVDSGAGEKPTICLLLKGIGEGIKWLFIGVFIVSILSVCGVRLMPMLCGLGITALPITLGAQNTFKNLIDGIFFVFAKQAKIGDFIQTGDFRGIVEAISLRGLTLRQDDGAQIYIPFSEIGAVTNFNSDYSVIKTPLTFSLDCPIEHIVAVVREAIDALKKEYPKHILGEPKINFCHTDPDGISVVVKVRTKTDPLHAFQTTLTSKIIEIIQAEEKVA